MTLNVNVAGWVSTTSAAVSVTRSRRPVSGCPGRYCRAANGVAVESDAVRQCVPLARQVCQVYATAKLSSFIPRGSRPGDQRSPAALTTPPSCARPAIRSAPWCTGAGMVTRAAICAAAASVRAAAVPAARSAPGRVRPPRQACPRPAAPAASAPRPLPAVSAACPG